MTENVAGSQRVSFLGLGFDVLDEAAALREVVELAGGSAFSFVVTPNVDHIVRLHSRRDDNLLWASYREASLSLCDSRIVYALGRVSGIELTVVPGSDLTALLLTADHPIASMAVVGGDTQLIESLSARFPRFNWYHHAPPRGVSSNSAAQLEIIDFVEACPAQVTLFAIGSPQSETLCARIAERKKAAGVALCVGASLEFVTGAKSRAPVWMQAVGLEWFYRLVTEPGRLWRRYLLEGPRIFGIWWRWRFHSSR